MQMPMRLRMLTAFAVVAACGSPPAAAAGRYLVYRDPAGAVLRQFDYPDATVCQRVEALAGREARCQVEPEPGFGARASLRYLQVGITVVTHYADMNSCRADTDALPPGVQLLEACSEPRLRAATDPPGAEAPRIETMPPAPAVPAAVTAAPRIESGPVVPQPPAARQPVARPQLEGPPLASTRPLCSAASEAAGLCKPR